MNREKTIFVKRRNSDWIINGLIVDDMIHASTSEKLKRELIAGYKEGLRSHKTTL